MGKQFSLFFCILHGGTLGTYRIRSSMKNILNEGLIRKKSFESQLKFYYKTLYNVFLNKLGLKSLLQKYQFLFPFKLSLQNTIGTYDSVRDRREQQKKRSDSNFFICFSIGRTNRKCIVKNVQFSRFLFDTHSIYGYNLY